MSTAVAPNRLGQVLGYLTTAYSYAQYVRASSGPDSSGKRKGFFGALSAMANRDAWSGSETMDVEAIYRLAITSAWWFSGVTLIANRVSDRASTFKVKKRIGEELRDIKNHAFEILVQAPNSLMTFNFLMTYTVLWYFLKGEAYLFLSTPLPGYGEPEEIWPIPANKCRPLPATLRKSRLTNKLCIDYEYTVDGKIYILPGENIIHIRNPNPFDYWSGLSFSSASLQFLNIDFHQGKYTEEYYGRDNAVPTAIISLPADTDPELFEAAKEQLRDEFGNKRRSAIIRAGDFTVDVISQNFRDSDFVNMRTFNRDSIWALLGIPEGAISGASSGDSRLAAETAFIRNTVQPLLDRIAAELTKDAGPYYGPMIVIEAPSIVPADRAMEVNEYNAYYQERTIDENRRVLGLPPVEPTGIEALDMFFKVPIRLFAYVSSNTYAATQPDPYADPYADPTLFGDDIVNVPPGNVTPNGEIGDMTGAPNAENSAQQEIGKATVVPNLRAMAAAGIANELTTWKKVSLREIRAGRNPANLVFTTDIIPENVYREIQGRIHNQNEDSIKSTFDSYIGRYRKTRS